MKIPVENYIEMITPDAFYQTFPHASEGDISIFLKNKPEEKLLNCINSSKDLVRVLEALKARKNLLSDKEICSKIELLEDKLHEISRTKIPGWIKGVSDFKRIYANIRTTRGQINFLENYRVTLINRFNNIFLNQEGKDRKLYGELLGLISFLRSLPKKERASFLKETSLDPKVIVSVRIYLPDLISSCAGNQDIALYFFKSFKTYLEVNKQALFVEHEEHFLNTIKNFENDENSRIKKMSNAKKFSFILATCSMLCSYLLVGAVAQTPLRFQRLYSILLTVLHSFSFYKMHNTLSFFSRKNNKDPDVKKLAPLLDNDEGIIELSKAFWGKVPFPVSKEGSQSQLNLKKLSAFLELCNLISQFFAFRVFFSSSQRYSLVFASTGLFFKLCAWFLMKLSLNPTTKSFSKLSMKETMDSMFNVLNDTGNGGEKGNKSGEGFWGGYRSWKGDGGGDQNDSRFKEHIRRYLNENRSLIDEVDPTGTMYDRSKLNSSNRAEQQPDSELPRDTTLESGFNFNPKQKTALFN